MRDVYSTCTRLYGTCGADVEYAFTQYKGWGDVDVEVGTHRNDWNTGGAGWKVAGFVSTAACEAAYEALKERYKIVFQGERRRNRNSGNSFIFVLYDTRRTRHKDRAAYIADCNKDKMWPFRKFDI